MALIDGTVVNVALPALQHQFNATVVDAQWVIEAYSLLLAALLLVGGALGDRFGRRRIFCLGATIFALTSVWCGLAPTIGQLVIARGAQGIGGALLVPGSLALLSASFGEERRGKAIGTWSGFSAITTAIGPVLGGWLIEHISWRAVFFINLPLAVAVVAISYWHAPESRNVEESGGLDYGGAGLVSAGLGAVVYGLVQSSIFGFGDLKMVATLGAGALLLAGFLAFEARTPNPMLPLRLFRSRQFSGANLLTLFLYAALSGALFFVPLNLIEVQKYSATAAGAALLPFILVMFVLSRWSGGLVNRHGAKLPLVAGPTLAALGFLLFSAAGISGSYWTTFFPATVVLGLGMAVSVAPLTTTVMGAVPEKRAGVASGVNNAVARTAGLLGIAVLGIVFLQLSNSFHRRHNGPRETAAPGSALSDSEGVRSPGGSPGNDSEAAKPDNVAFVSGFRVVMYSAAGLALASALIALTMVDGKRLPGSRPARLPPV